MPNKDFEIAALWPNKSGVGYSGKLDVAMFKEAVADGCNRISMFDNKYHEEGDNRPHKKLLASKGYARVYGENNPSNPPVTQAQPVSTVLDKAYVEDDIPF